MSDSIQKAMANRLRALTPARVGLSRAGISQMTQDVLDFQLCHAQARDAVHARLDVAVLVSALTGSAELAGDRPILALQSAAYDRQTYLQRPDLGRQLSNASRPKLTPFSATIYELAFIVCDGLSALAVERHVPALLEQLLPRLSGRAIAPLCIVEQGRVAIGDEIGAALRTQLAVVLIGERPGLSSPDSLGAYVTWHPQCGRTDAERICISNIRPQGLDYPEATAQLERVIAEAFEFQLTGIAGSRASLPGKITP